MLTNNPLDDEVNSKTIYNRIKRQEVPEINLTKKSTRPLGEIVKLNGESMLHMCVCLSVCFNLKI